MKIGILADPADACAAALAAEIERVSGAPCPVLDLAVAPSSAVSLDAAGVRWSGVSLDALDTLVVSGFDFEDPLVPRAQPSADWGVWQIDYIVDQQRRSFVASVLRELERRGVRVVNSWRALNVGFAGARAFGELARAGLEVPPWLCTNDMEAAQRFCSAHGRVLWRPASGRARWQPFLDKQRMALLDAAKPPVLLAGLPEEAPVRVFVCRGEALLAIQHSAPMLDPLEHMEEVWVADCGAHLAELARAAAALGADWLQLAYVPREGRTVFYEVDPDPRYAWLPAEYRAYLQARLARRLLDLPAPPQDELPLPPRRERESLFVRRMLATLHEMEASKYSKP